MKNPPLYLSCRDEWHAAEYARAEGIRDWRWLKTGDKPENGAVVRVLGRWIDSARFKRLSKRRKQTRGD